MIVSFPKETRQNFPPKFYGAGGLLQQQYPMVWSCAVLKLQVGLSCSIPPYLYVYHTRWLLSTSKLKSRNYTCIIFLTEYPCKNTLTGITDFFIMCLGQVNLTKEEWESHILQYYRTCHTDSKVVLFRWSLVSQWKLVSIFQKWKLSVNQILFSDPFSQ